MIKKVIFFTNIIAPYRVNLFNKLKELSLETRFDFEVYFMRLTESNRDWEIKLEDLKFKYKIGKGLYFHLKNYYFFHFNPKLLFKAIQSKEEIILGASWNNVNALILVFLKSIGLINNTLSVWSEANYLTNSSQKKNIFRDKLRAWFFTQIDGYFIIPGKMAQISFEKWNIQTGNIILLPNLVSLELFGKNNKYENDLNKKPIFFIVARLEENIKGILNFFKAIGVNNIKKIKIKVAGTGSSLEDYTNYINENNLEDNIHFLGNLSLQEISFHYHQSNVFVLPSFSDPSPLTLVEAITSGLPVLVSERCGNHFEAVEDGKNGYTFNPYDVKDIKDKFEKLLDDRYKNKWEEFSKYSIVLSKQNFDNKIVLSRFIKSYLNKKYS